MSRIKKLQLLRRGWLTRYWTSWVNLLLSNYPLLKKNFKLKMKNNQKIEDVANFLTRSKTFKLKIAAD